MNNSICQISATHKLGVACYFTWVLEVTGDADRWYEEQDVYDKEVQWDWIKSKMASKLPHQRYRLISKSRDTSCSHIISLMNWGRHPEETIQTKAETMGWFGWDYLWKSMRIRAPNKIPTAQDSSSLFLFLALILSIRSGFTVEQQTLPLPGFHNGHQYYTRLKITHDNLQFIICRASPVRLPPPLPSPPC